MDIITNLGVGVAYSLIPVPLMEEFLDICAVRAIECVFAVISAIKLGWPGEVTLKVELVEPTEMHS
eukprot:CAMPEP_0185578304 /NCGR_PEP_ID=MMETSP0434-20130131/12551_2 /TAXON_ID=626734 ORGANISM="Favella taraikaensis, Strain Fe Narragansett Bay" /NCGR_SAMPLE_ID=MMETSP0434 /ASSEMBLY_ACC=CAM_ASM_000379 /LENGTH=65 /DNA_ID=CAMNT_0028196071 /DNA_START=161 /DNA_END=358 /DNA_ORIENTATION=-